MTLVDRRWCRWSTSTNPATGCSRPCGSSATSAWRCRRGRGPSGRRHRAWFLDARRAGGRRAERARTKGVGRPDRSRPRQLPRRPRLRGRRPAMSTPRCGSSARREGVQLPSDALRGHGVGRRRDHAPGRRRSTRRSRRCGRRLRTATSSAASSTGPRSVTRRWRAHERLGRRQRGLAERALGNAYLLPRRPRRGVVLDGPDAGVGRVSRVVRRGSPMLCTCDRSPRPASARGAGCGAGRRGTTWRRPVRVTDRDRAGGVRPRAWRSRVVRARRPPRDRCGSRRARRGGRATVGSRRSPAPRCSGWRPA